MMSFYLIIRGLVILSIAFIPLTSKWRIPQIQLGLLHTLTYTTDTARSASYLDLLLKIDREGWLRTKLYDKRCDFIFPIVNIPFICIWSTVYISQLIWYFRVCGSYHDFLNKGLLLTRKLLNQGFLVNMLKLSLQNLYGHYHDLVNRYRIYMCLKWPQVCSIVVIIIINAKVIEEPQI